MIKRKLTRGDIYLIAANLLPVAGAWLWGWNAIEIFTVYVLETLVLGILTVLKLSIASLAGNYQEWYVGDTKKRQPGILIIVFFIIHYGLFAAVQTSIFSESANLNPPGTGMLHFFFHFYEYINLDTAWLLGGFVLSYLFGNFVPFLWKREYKTLPMTLIMFQPYGRIITQQLTVLAGSMFLTTGGGKIFILVFAVVKIWVDLYLNFDAVLNKSMAESSTEPLKEPNSNKEAL